jgi:hypothetical protein
MVKGVEKVARVVCGTEDQLHIITSSTSGGPPLFPVRPGHNYVCGRRGMAQPIPN